MATSKEISSPMLQRRATSNIDIHAFLASCINKARDELLFKDFEGCLNTCENAISQAKFYTHDYDGGSREERDFEVLSVLAIQAYAELNQWACVIPFVQKVYGQIENCPAEVILLCVMLHAKVKEYAHCLAIVNLWLRNEDNFDNTQYSEVVGAYISQVLLKNGKYGHINSFIDSCAGLGKSDKISLKEIFAKDVAIGLKSEVEQTHCEQPYNPQEPPCKVKHPGNNFVSIVKRVGLMLRPYNISTLFKVAFVSLFAYCLFFRGNTGDLTLGKFPKFSLVVQGMMTVVRNMFWRKPG